MTPETGQKITAINILSNIARSKENQAIKHGHLIKCDMRKKFLQKPCKKRDKETSSRPLFVFLKSLI